MADALGTGGGVVSAVDHRLDQAGLIAPQTSSLAVRTGVLWAPGSTTLITGTSATGTMTVNIAAHHWVTTRGTADGVYIGTREAAGTVNIAAAPGSNSRIDLIYEKQNDSGSTVSPDGSTGELYGVVTGVANISPTKPALPVGAIELGTITLTSIATSTNGAGSTIANTVAQTVARGADIPCRNQAERDALTTYPLLTVKRLDTGAIERRNVGNTAWETVANPSLPPFTCGTVTVTLNSNGDTDIAHGLGAVPSAVSLTLLGITAPGQYGKLSTYGALTSTIIPVRVWDARTGTAMGSFAGAQISWVAFR